MIQPTNLDRFLHGDPTEQFSLCELREIFTLTRSQGWPIDILLVRVYQPEEVKFDA